MTNSQRLQAVRELLRSWLRQHVPDFSDASQAAESILIRKGFYCGQVFKFPGYRAVWFIEEEELKISTTDGQPLARLPTGQPSLSDSIFQFPTSDAEQPSELQRRAA